MGLLTRILQKADEAKDVVDASRSIPKRDMNPLIKRRMEELAKKIDEENAGSTDYSDETIGKMYSPLISTAEQMDIGLEGTKGENIEAFLRKRAPNVTEAEKQFYQLGFEPQKKYTREEVLDTLNEINTEYTIRRTKDKSFEGVQQQPIAAKKEAYEEITIDSDKGSIPLGEEVAHFNPETVVHTRLSVVRPLDDPEYQAVLVEEIQSDLYKIDNLTERQMENAMRKTHTPFSGNLEEMNPHTHERIPIPAVEWHIATIDGYASEYALKVSNEKAVAVMIDTFDRLEKLQTNTRDPELLERAKRDIKETARLKLKDNGIIVSGKDTNELYENALRYMVEVDEAYVDEADIDAYGGIVDFFETQADSFVSEVMEDYNQILKNNVDKNKGYGEYNPNADPRKPVPVKSKTDVVRKGILANIAYAKDNGIDKILVPDYREIAKQRVNTFSSIAHTIKDQETAKKFMKFYNANDEDAANQVAQEYFEKVFKPIYKDALTKVLGTLMRETKGQIKVGKKLMPYKDVLNNKTEMKTLTEIDITDFEFDPKNDALRFNRGGLAA